MVNALHSRLKEFLEPFHGVATRRLQHYLDWFCYREQFRKSDADKREVTFADAAAGKYTTSKILGYVFAQIVSQNVFGSSIMFRPLLIPITILASVLVTGIGLRWNWQTSLA